MDVASQASLSGYISKKTELKYGQQGGAVLLMNLGQKHYRKEQDGSFTLTNTSYAPLVLFGATAEAVDQRFQVGDDVVALGEFKSRTFERDGQQIDIKEFHTYRLVFDTSHPRYEVIRVSRGSAANAVPSSLTNRVNIPPVQYEPASRPSNDAVVFGR